MSKKKDKEEELEFTEEEKKQYAQRLMRIKCSYGTKVNYINIPVDHGVVAGSDQQPLLNANDHVGGTGNNIIHFGKCHSDHNPNRMVIRYAFCLVDSVDDVAEDWGIIGLDCTPVVEKVWDKTNDKNKLDGAPALLLGSCATCRYGGIIHFVKQDPEDSEDDDSEDEEEDTVQKETEALVAAAMEKISSTGDDGAQIVKDVQMYLLLAAVQSADGSKGLETYGIDEMIQEAWYVPFNQCIPSQETIDNNYIHNMSLPAIDESVLESNMLLCQDALEDFRINYFDASQVGCGAVAAYNTNLILDPETSMSFASTIWEMEPYGIMSSPFGLMPSGLINYYLRYDMQVSYEVTDIASGIGAADAGIIMYVTQDNVHYVSCQQNEDGTFTFYNTEDEQGKQTMQFEDFVESLEEEDLIGMAALTISKKEDQ